MSGAPNKPVLPLISVSPVLLHASAAVQPNKPALDPGVSWNAAEHTDVPAAKQYQTIILTVVVL